MRIDGISSRPSIEHQAIGPKPTDVANVATGEAFDLRHQETLSPQTVSITTAPSVLPPGRNPSRRGFLSALGVGVAAVAVNAVAPNLAWSRDFTKQEIKEEDEMIVKALTSLEGEEPEIDLMEGDKVIKPSEEQIKRFIDLLTGKSRNSGKGVHIQRSKNAKWLIAYFNHKTFTRKEVLYYPSKIGLDSKFVKAIAKDPKVKKVPFDRKKINKNGTTDIYMKEGEDLHYTNKVRAIEAVIDVGTAYVIIPAGTPIIEYIDKNGDKKGMLAECRNPIKRYLSEDCPPSK